MNGTAIFQVAQARPRPRSQGGPLPYPSVTNSNCLLQFISFQSTSFSSSPLFLIWFNLSLLPLGIAFIPSWVISLLLLLPPIRTVAGVTVLNHKSDHVIPIFKISPWVACHMLQRKPNFLHLPIVLGPRFSPHCPVIPSSAPSQFQLPVTPTHAHAYTQATLSTGHFVST